MEISKLIKELQKVQETESAVDSGKSEDSKE